MRSFNTAGPVNPIDNYLIAPLSRIDLRAVLGLVRDKKYFVLHAPRQTGKTSVLLALAELLNERGYGCVYATVETARTARDDVQRAMRVVLAALANAASALGDRFLRDIWAATLDEFGPDLALNVALERWAEASPRPAGAADRRDPTRWWVIRCSRCSNSSAPATPAARGASPHSVVLCGMRDMRDYRMGAAGSPFNIVAESLRLGDFSREETVALLGQHTTATGQAFRSGGAGGSVGADARPALAGECAGARDVLQDPRVAAGTVRAR